ncbi:MAG: hypothetical protein R3C97_03515 [Geminicoccaceae bacterium]
MDIYSVSGIEVDVSARSAVDAQTQAIAEAQRIGLRRLMRNSPHPPTMIVSRTSAASMRRKAMHDHEVERRQVAATRYVASILVSATATACAS